MMREIRGVMAGRLALMTLIVAQQEPLMKVLPWKSKIPDCSSYISPPAVLKPIHFSLPRLNHRINRALGKFETLTTTTFYRLTTAANDLFFFKWKQIEPEFIPLCDSNDPFHVDSVRLIHQCDPMVQYLELWGRAYFAFAIGSYPCSNFYWVIEWTAALHTQRCDSKPWKVLTSGGNLLKIQVPSDYD